MSEVLTMTRRELDRLRIIRQVLERKLTWSQAAVRLTPQVLLRASRSARGAPRSRHADRPPVPPGAPRRERGVIRTLKEECVWLREWTSPFALADAVTTWIERDYNTQYLHSALGYRTPEQFEHAYSHQTRLAPAYGEHYSRARTLCSHPAPQHPC